MMKRKYYFRKFSKAEKLVRKTESTINESLYLEDKLLLSKPLTQTNYGYRFRHMPKELQSNFNRIYISGQYCASHTKHVFVMEGSHKDYPDALPAKDILNALNKKFSTFSASVKINAGEFDNKHVIAGHIVFEFHDDQYVKGDWIFQGNQFIALKNIMHALGYFFARAWGAKNQNNNVYFCQFEPYKFNYGDQTIEDNLYHITTELAGNSIVKCGFKSSSKSNMFTYPDRNYFFIKKDLRKQIGYMYAANKININNKGQNIVVSITIVSNIPEVLWFSDPNIEDKGAVYCYEDISTAAITKAEFYKV